MYFLFMKIYFYTFLFLIMLITLITSGSLTCAFAMNANDMHIKGMFIWTFWFLICMFPSSYEFVMNFRSIGQTVKGHMGILGGKSKGKTEHSRKVRFQLGAKMHLSLKIYIGKFINVIFALTMSYIVWLHLLKTFYS